jgi:hypothetical protein
MISVLRFAASRVVERNSFRSVEPSESVKSRIHARPFSSSVAWQARLEPIRRKRESGTGPNGIKLTIKRGSKMA